MGNVVNRVFDSSGPEGKVRGTPQQIIDKYNQLARDAQLSNDRVATENFQQHAEHYLRMLAEALKEQAERQAQQQNQQRNNNQNNNNQHSNNQPNNAPQNQNRDDQPAPDDRRAPAAPPPMAEGQPQPQTAQPDVPAAPPAADVIDVDKSESALVETPENKAPPKPRRRKPKPAPEAAPEAAPVEDQPTPPADAAE